MHYTLLSLGFLVLNTLGSFGQNMKQNLEKKIKIDLIAITGAAIDQKDRAIKQVKEMISLLPAVKALSSLETKVEQSRKNFMSQEIHYVRSHNLTNFEFNTIIIDKIEARHKEVAERDFKTYQAITFDDIERDLMISELKLLRFNTLKVALNEEGFYPDVLSEDKGEKFLQGIRAEIRALIKLRYKLSVDVGLKKEF